MYLAKVHLKTNSMIIVKSIPYLIKS